jgi:hypothetical protein
VRWAARVLVYIICVGLLGAIAGGVVSVWVRIIMHDY